ncbi:MAG: hypothetical protein EZS28_018576 [Streblomastix strix]|uniref:Uncharacterized protein n=1 Tax=Streblomastix strix TaxID=222440 RepID=A0A5J4VUQ1_9EUKA|nr:MAG: hypothetical protein EZS28_018576 [Streblomastix strix]
MQSSSSSDGGYVSDNSSLFDSQRQLMYKTDPIVAQQSLFGKNKRKNVDMNSVEQALTQNVAEQQAPILQTSVHTGSLAQTAPQIVPRGVSVQGTAGIMSLSQQFDDKEAVFVLESLMEVNESALKCITYSSTRLWGVNADVPKCRKTESFTEQLIDGYKLALLATEDALNVREQLRGDYAKLDMTKIYSETTNQRMIENMKLQQGNFGYPASASFDLIS